MKRALYENANITLFHPLSLNAHLFIYTSINV